MNYATMRVGTCVKIFRDPDSIPVGMVFAAIRVKDRGYFYVYDPLCDMREIAKHYYMRVPNPDYGSEWWETENTWLKFDPNKGE